MQTLYVPGNHSVLAPTLEKPLSEFGIPNPDNAQILHTSTISTLLSVDDTRKTDGKPQLLAMPGKGLLHSAANFLPDAVIVGGLIGGSTYDFFKRRHADYDNERLLEVISSFIKEECGIQKLSGKLKQEINRGVLRAMRRDLLLDATDQLKGDLGLTYRNFETTPEMDSFLPKIIVCPDAAMTSSTAGAYASLFAHFFPWGFVTGATGNTYLGVYKAMESTKDTFNQNGIPVDYSKMLLTHLDEYVGVDRKAEHSFARYMNDNVAVPLGFSPENCHFIRGETLHPEDQATFIRDQREQMKLRALYRNGSGAPGICFLGIGPSEDPHIGFVPKNTDPMTLAGIFDLDPATVARDVERGQPPHLEALSLGVRAILGHPLQMMVATGTDKGKSLAHSLTPFLTPEFPASMLQFAKDRSVIFIDQAAADELQRAVMQHDWSNGISYKLPSF